MAHAVASILTPFHLIFISVALSAMAQVLLKAGMSSAAVQGSIHSHGTLTAVAAVLGHPFVLLGLALYFASALVWLLVLSKVPLSFAYPFVALGIALTTLLGHLIFHETLNPMKVLGTAVILLGILLLARS